MIRILPETDYAEGFQGEGKPTSGQGPTPGGTGPARDAPAVDTPAISGGADIAGDQGRGPGDEADDRRGDSAPPLTMAMRALLRKMDETGLPLTPSSSGNGYVLVTRSVLGGGRIHFWTPLHVGRAAFELGYADQYRGITKAGRRAIRRPGVER